MSCNSYNTTAIGQFHEINMKRLNAGNGNQSNSGKNDSDGSCFSDEWSRKATFDALKKSGEVRPPPEALYVSMPIQVESRTPWVSQTMRGSKIILTIQLGWKILTQTQSRPDSAENIFKYFFVISPPPAISQKLIFSNSMALPHLLMDSQSIVTNCKSISIKFKNLRSASVTFNHISIKFSHATINFNQFQSV